MPTTSNFGWTTPADTDLVKDGAAAIRTLGNGIDTSFLDLKGGTTGQVLSKASNTDLDFSWVAQDDSNAIQNAIVDAKGDLISATAADTPARLAVGSNGQYLKADSTTATGLAWATLPSSGAVVQVVGATYTTDTSSASSTFTDTGLTATITPTSASNKVLVIIHHNSCGKSGTDTRLRIRAYRGATQIAQLEGTGGANDSTTSNFFGGISIAYLDSPATTSATTYKTQFSSRANTGTVHINTAIDSTTSASTITLMEVTP